MSDLRTEDFKGIEVLHAGVRIHGGGSPPDGDVFNVADLHEIATAGRELAGEVRAPVKLGHGKQRALEGLEPPAAGWVENLRVDGNRLLADLRRVPGRVAELIRSGAFRTRSLELRTVVSQSTGRRYGKVATGLALLGATAPAVRTLDDILRLYEADVRPGTVLGVTSAEDTAGADALREVRRFRAEPLVDAAIADGRLARDHRDEILRCFEQDFELATELFDELRPNPRRAFANAYDAEDDASERAEIARTFGLHESEVA